LPKPRRLRRFSISDARFALFNIKRDIANRQLGKRFGDQAYAMEELIAELGAAFLCADLRITDEPRADHAQYLASWLSVLKADKKAIFTAASKASEAAAFLAALQGA
jgi:antirestriction protein ArdC